MKTSYILSALLLSALVLLAACTYNYRNTEQANNSSKSEYIPVTKITIVGGSTVKKGSSVQLTAIIEPENATDTSVTWGLNYAKGVSIANGKVTVTNECERDSFKVSVWAGIMSGVIMDDTPHDEMTITVLE